MDIIASVKKNDVAYKSVMDAIELLKKREVLIGIPENTANRKDDESTPVNNAELLFIHNNGSPVNNIPPRPVLEPAITQNQERVSASLKVAIDAAVAGKKSEIQPALEKAGMEGQNIARKFFTDSTNNFVPNAPITIKRKGSARPLIDTGEMRKSITYIVREVK